MYIGTQLSAEQLAARGDPYLRQLLQLGVRNVCIDPPGSPYSWTRDGIERVSGAGGYSWREV
jgi:mannonate dehydratase